MLAKKLNHQCWVAGFLLCLTAMHCPADVFNHSSKTLFLLSEESGKVFELPPGGAFYGRQDAILLPHGAGVRVFKTVDHVDAVVSPRRSIITYGGNLFERCGQWLIGGWIDRRPIAYSWVKHIDRSYREFFG